MNKSFLIALLLCLSLSTFAQTEIVETQPPINNIKNACLTVGILQGGGSLVGVDFEALLIDKVGLQIGAGFIGYGAGINYHFKPGIRSSFISMQYWHQGIGDTFISVLGPTYVFRGKKWFTAQLGLGFVLDSDGVSGVPDAMLLYSIGAYFPL